MFQQQSDPDAGMHGEGFCGGTRRREGRQLNKIEAVRLGLLPLSVLIS